MRWTCPAPNANSMLIPILFLALAISVAHTEFKVTPVRLYGDAPYSHRRLYGIRRLKVIRPLLTPMGEVERTATVRRHQAAEGVTSNYAAHVPRIHVVTPKMPNATDRQSHTVEKVRPSTKSPLDPPRTIDDFDELKRKRIEARWRRLGINLRTIKYPHRKTAREKSLELEKLQAIAKNSSVESKNAEKQIDDPSLKKDEIHVTRSPNTRKSVPTIVADKNVYQRELRRPRIHGPILGVVPVDEDARDTGNGDSSGTEHQSITASSEWDVQPIPVVTPLPRFASPVANPSPKSDYHSRTIPVVKNYKYAQKLGQRPRLRIRRPGDKSIAENSIQEDPNLTPFQNSARSRFGYGNLGGFNGPAPYHRTVPPPPSSEVPTVPQTPQTTQTTTKATTTTTEATTTTTEAVASTEGEPEAGTDESGAGFGLGPSELPPELANVGFGIGGNGVNVFNVPGPEAPSPPPESPAPKPKRPKQRKQPNPEIFKEGEPLVIPQNSGLRPVAPPKEFLDGGGFGPQSGSIAGGFGGGSGGGFGGGGGGSGSGFGGGIGGGGGAGGGFGGGAGGDKPEPPASSGAEPPSDLFTGDSALVPSRGPTGDGYGPPIFPGGAIPPPVPAVGLGGAAAGKSPYAAMIEPTENPPTTVKPSALLSMLNKADQGLNQAITHFEQKSPIETAAIDILEVALGSQKLDSQAKLLGHVDRTIGLDNLQRIQRWANTAGAMDVFKEEMVKFIKHLDPPENLFPTLPPELEYLFKPSGR